MPTIRLASHEGATHALDRKSTRLNSSHQIISYAVFCLKKKKRTCQAAVCKRTYPKTPTPTWSPQTTHVCSRVSSVITSSSGGAHRSDTCSHEIGHKPAL